VHPRRYILCIGRDDSSATILHLDGHSITVQVNGDIAGSIQKFDPREARVQVGEDVYTRTHNIERTTSMPVVGGTSARWRQFETTSELARSRRGLRWGATIYAYLGIGKDRANFDGQGLEQRALEEDVQKQGDG
jgi:hypothetical protein